MKLILQVLAVAALVLVGCGKSNDGGSGSGNGTTNTQDIYGVVSTGLSLSFNDLTGGANDIALDPTTKLPAVAYYDKNAPVSGTTAVGALKYAYMSSNGAWITEVVDANYGTAVCGTVNSFCLGAPNAANGSTTGIIKLAFTSTGVPVIAYVFGASLAGGNKQIRYAERINGGQSPWKTSVAYSIGTSAAATNANILATVDPMKGVALQLDSSDRPHIVFNVYTQTLTNSATRYLFRASSGVWTVNDIITHLSGAGAIAAVNTGGNQMGMALCPSTGRPFVAGGVVTGAAAAMTPYLFYCSALSSTTGACTTWVTVNLLTGCSGGLCFSSGIGAGANAGTRADAVYDPANGKILLGYYNVSTTALTVGESGVCASAQPTAVGSYGAGVTVGPGASTPGLNGFRLAASSTRWLAAYTNTTINTMFNLAPTAGAFLNPGHIIDTTTVAAEGVGLVYDTTNDRLWASYASLPAAAAGAFGNDIKVGHANSTDLVVSGANGTLYTDVVDTTVTLYPSAAVPMVTAARAPNGTVGYSFFYQDNTVTNNRLYYGQRSGTATAPTFSQNLVSNYNVSAAGQLVGSYPSLAYDSNSNPFIAFYSGLATDNGLYIATSSNGGNYFSLTAVDRTANVGQFPAVATFGTAVAVAYYDVTNRGLKFARFVPGSGWKRYGVDGGGSGTGCNNLLEDAGSWAALRFTSTGRPVIAYQSNATNLKVAYATEAVTSSTFTWTCLTLDASAATRGQGVDMVLNSNDLPFITHFDATAGTIRMVTCSNAIGTCVTTGPNAFTGSIVNGVGTTATIVTRPSLQVDNTNKIYLGYYSASFQGLQIASQASGATTWTLENIDASQSGSSYISAAGQYAQLLLNSSNLPMAFYRSNENWLKYFSREPR